MGARLRAGAAAIGATVALAGCLGDRPDATGAIGRASLTAAAPRAIASPRPADTDEAELVAAYGGVYRSATLDPLLREVADALVARTERPEEGFAVAILDSPKVNAFALPSRRLYVTRGLLALASDTDEVAAVLAHEMAHVLRRHAQSRLERERRSALVSRVAVELLNDPSRGEAIRTRDDASLASFSRIQELEADALGIATLAAAGFDPDGAARFLRALGREAAQDRRDGADPDGRELSSSHPATSERIALATAAARRLRPEPAPDPAARARWLSALDGLPYGDKPADGLVRGRSFVHPGLGIAVEAPAGLALENTPRAVLGASRDGRLRFLFDAVEAKAETPLGAMLTGSWSDPIEPGSLRDVSVGGREAALASSSGEGWTFRLAALRLGPTAFRIVLAGKGAAVARLDRTREAVLASLRPVSPEEAASLRTRHVAVVVAGGRDTTDALAGRDVRPAATERVAILNGLARGAPLVPGARYKVVVD